MAEEEIGPAKISFPTFLFKIVAGVAGGSVGTLIMLLIFILASSLLTPLSEAVSEGSGVSPVFIFILMIMIFLSSTSGNILSALLLSFTEKDKYTRRASTVYQIFIVSILIFLLMVPVYFITASIDIGLVAYAVALHIIITAQVSALVLEIISNFRYALVGVYGVTFAVLLSAAVMFGLARLIVSPTILLFVALPVVWGSIAFIQSIVTMIYGWTARIYDKDFLSTQTLYGADYGSQVADEEEEDKEVENEAGADFLRKN